MLRLPRPCFLLQPWQGLLVQQQGALYPCRPPEIELRGGALQGKPMAVLQESWGQQVRAPNQASHSHQHAWTPAVQWMSCAHALLHEICNWAGEGHLQIS